MTPRHARYAVGAFVLLSAGVAGNIMFVQDAPANRASIERGQQRPPSESTRRQSQPAPAEPNVAGVHGSSNQPVIINAQSAVSTPLLTAKPTVGTGNNAAPAAPGDTPEITASIQRELQARGYEPGTPDGMAGAVTRAAIMAWESDHGIALTGEPTEAVMKAIVLGVNGPAAAQITAQWQGLPKERRARSEQLIRTVQQSLSGLGYNLGKVSGRMNEDTERAIREFETDQTMTPSGRISGPLVARLTRLTGTSRNTAQRQ